MPEAVDVFDLERARLAQDEVAAVAARDPAFLPRAEQAVLLHVPTDGCVAGHDAEARVLARQGHEVVVVQLERPAWVIAVLPSDGLAERVGDARMRAGMAWDLARESRERVVATPGDVEPALDRLEREPDGVAGGGVAPGSGRQLLDALPQLAVLGR